MPVAFDYDGGAERNAPRPAKDGKRFWADAEIEPYSWFRASGDLRDQPTGPLQVWTKWPACRSGMRALGVVNLVAAPTVKLRKASALNADGAPPLTTTNSRERTSPVAVLLTLKLTRPSVREAESTVAAKSAR